MANVDHRRGFWPTRQLSGGQISAPSQYTVAANTTIYRGAPVKRNGSGYITNASAGDGVAVVGIAADYAAAAASSTSTTVKVWDDPGTVFGVQTVSSTSYTIAMEGATCDHVGSSGSATTGNSYVELNIGTLNSGSAAQQFIIQRLIPRADNVASSQHADVEVVVNESQHKGAGAAGV